MKFKHPTMEQVPVLWSLWRDAFGDEDEYLEIFYSKAFSPERSLCLLDDTGKALAALYWFDCRASGEKIAYVFGVAVSSACRGRGYCRAMMEATMACLTERGYKGAVLVPAKESLYPMYEKLGFEKFGGVTETEYLASSEKVAIREIDAKEYLRLRNAYLPQGGVIQEGENIDFLAARTHLYAGEDFVFSFVPGMGEFIVELLGNAEKSRGIIRALGRERLVVRTPGTGRDFAMYYALDKGFSVPTYFGLPFDF